MKSNRGVTTTSLIIYITAMLVVVGIIANITSFFYANVLNLKDITSIAELTKFNMYFLEEIKKDENKVLQCENNHIKFESGNIFLFQDKCIYFNSIRICENVENAQFKLETINDKIIIKVLFTLGKDTEYTKISSYVLK